MKHDYDNLDASPLASFPRFKIVVSSLVQACLKYAGPWGEAINQALFGTIDKLENAEIKTILEDIRKILRDNIELESSDCDSNAALLEKVLLALDAFSERISPIEKQLSTLNNLSISALRAFLFSSESNKENHALLSELLRKFDDYFSSSSTTLDYIAKTTDETYKLLKDLYNMISKAPLPPKSSVAFDHQRLHRNLRSFNHSNTLREFANFLTSLHAGLAIEAILDPVLLTNCIFTIDFSEIYRYIFPPISPSVQDSCSAYILDKPIRPLYLLPPSLGKLERVVSSFRSPFSDPKALANRFQLSYKNIRSARCYDEFVKQYRQLNLSERHILTNLVSRSKSPIAALTELFDNKYLMPFMPDIDHKEVGGRAKAYFDLFKHARRRIWTAPDMTDAFVLAYLSVANSGLRCKERYIFHITGAKSSFAVWNMITGDNMTLYGHSREGRPPILLDPIGYAFNTFNHKNNGHNQHEHIRATEQYLSYAVEELARLYWALKKLFINEGLKDISIMLQIGDIAKDLCELIPYFESDISSFVEDVRKATISAIHLDTIYRMLMNLEIDRTKEIIQSICEDISELDRSYKGFREYVDPCRDF